MPIYPIEISQPLEDLLVKDQLQQALSIDEDTIENCLIKGIAFLEKQDNPGAIQLFEKLVNREDHRFKLAAQIELIFIQPIKYFNNRKLTKQLTAQIEKLPEKRQLARLLHALAILMQWRRNTPQALKYLFHSRNIYRKLKENEVLARILDTLGNVSSAIADHEQALLYYSESLALKTLLNDSVGQAITLGNLGRLCLQLGRYQQARSFVELDIALCENQAPDSKARLLNLLARIDIADEQWSDAEYYLNLAIEMLDAKQKDSLFFCIKDQVVLALKRKKLDGVKTRLSKLTKLLPEKSPYHQTQLQLIKNQFAQQNKGLPLEQAEQLLDDIESLELPEIELEYRIWLSQLACEQEQQKTAQQHLLLARKIARMAGFKRFLPQINSLMLELDIKENINEETIRPISDEITRVDDGYLIRKKLGGGGFGEVFLAHDMINDRDVAVKRFHAGDLMDHHQQKKRWNQARLEFEAVASITHPAIAKIYAIGHDSTGSPYLVQEYISGGDLCKMMGQSNDLSSALTYLIPVARALAAVHDVGVIHRDIKPENILLNQQGSTVLVDFGIALLKQSQTELRKKQPDNKQIQGTENYIAPEQKLSTDIDFRADLFSLGCVLYEWLSGDKVEIQQNKTNKLTSWLGVTKTAEVSNIDKNICGEAYELISSLLAFKPEDRPESASLVADQMQQILDAD